MGRQLSIGPGSTGQVATIQVATVPVAAGSVATECASIAQVLPNLVLTVCLLMGSAIAAPTQETEDPSLSPEAVEVHALFQARMWPEMRAKIDEVWGDASDVPTIELRTQRELDLLHWSGTLPVLLAAAEKVPTMSVPYAPYLSARVSLTLDLPERAAPHLERLENFLKDRGDQLPQETTQWYRTALANMQAEQKERMGIRDRGLTAVRRGQWVVGGALLLLLVGALLLRRR